MIMDVEVPLPSDGPTAPHISLPRTCGGAGGAIAAEVEVRHTIEVLFRTSGGGDGGSEVIAKEIPIVIGLGATPVAAAPASALDGVVWSSSLADKSKAEAYDRISGESVWELIKFALALALVVGCLYINFYVLWPKL